MARPKDDQAESGTLYRPPAPRRRGWVIAALALVVVAGLALVFRGELRELWVRVFGGEVSILLEVYPEGAEVYLDGARVLSNPIQLQRSQHLFLIRVEAKGYRPQTLRVLADRSQFFRVALTPRGRRAEAGARAAAPARPRRTSARPAGPRCPPGTTFVPEEDVIVPEEGAEGTCVDRFEHPGKGQLPRRGVSLEQARAACHARGARLCRVEEWVRACGSRFPYGETYQAGRCQTGADAVVAAGARPGCRSRFGVHDLSGNVSEWVEDGVAMGGDAKSEQGHASCPSRSGGGAMTGFRCCADPEWD